MNWINGFKLIIVLDLLIHRIRAWACIFHLAATLVIDEHVGRFKVTVSNVVLVQRFHLQCNLQHDLGCQVIHERWALILVKLDPKINELPQISRVFNHHKCKSVIIQQRCILDMFLLTSDKPHP